jgi:hypothetical protein
LPMDGQRSNPHWLLLAVLSAPDTADGDSSMPLPVDGGWTCLLTGVHPGLQV